MDVSLGIAEHSTTTYYFVEKSRLIEKEPFSFWKVKIGLWKRIALNPQLPKRPKCRTKHGQKNRLGFPMDGKQRELTNARNLGQVGLAAISGRA